MKIQLSEKDAETFADGISNPPQPNQKLIEAMEEYKNRQSFFKWIYPPSGNCPVQAEGWFRGYYFYFRSRGTTASIEFSFSEKAWNKGLIIARYELWHTKVEGRAGWLPKWFCRLLVWWGCVRFYF